MAYGASFRGGVFVAAGDINGDNIADIVTGPDEGSALDVKVFDGATLMELTSYSAFGSGFQGGVRVAVGDIDGDGRNDVITGAGPGGAPHVKVFDGQTDDLLRSFFAYHPNFTGGVYVASVPIPEPATLTLVALGFASLARRRDRGASLTSACGRRAA
jgi:hypothetical protein